VRASTLSQKEDAMYRNILLAVALQNWEQYSAHALAARDLAAALASHVEGLHVLSVYQDESIRIPTGVPAAMAVKLREQQAGKADEAAARKMDDFVVPLVARGLPITKLLRQGSPRHLIVEVAQEVGADLVVIGSHSKRGLLDIALGGTARHVSEHAPCPVVMVTPRVKK
jgi:nucleotide-binding universal stress UspA family protein